MKTSKTRLGAVVFTQSLVIASLIIYLGLHYGYNTTIRDIAAALIGICGLTLIVTLLIVSPQRLYKTYHTLVVTISYCIFMTLSMLVITHFHDVTFSISEYSLIYLICSIGASLPIKIAEKISKKVIA